MRRGVKKMMTLTEFLPIIILLIAVYIAGFIMGFFMAAGMNEQKGDEKDAEYKLQELHEEDDRVP